MNENAYQDKPLSAYFGDEKVKEKYVKRMQSHIEADELIRGEGWKDGKGCAVGCTLNKYNHACYQDELGLPEWLAILEDTLFENMSREKSKTFPLEFLKAIPLGANLDTTYHKFCKFLLTDIAKDCNKEPVRKAIKAVLTQHDKAIKGEITTLPWIWRAVSAARSAAGSAAWSAAWSAAEAARSAAESAEWSAAGSAAWSAAWSAAGPAAWSAAWSAAGSAARSAAWSAAWSAAGSAAGSAAESAAEAAESAEWSAAEAAGSEAFDKMADKLIELLKESKTSVTDGLSKENES